MLFRKWLKTGELDFLGEVQEVREVPGHWQGNLWRHAHLMYFVEGAGWHVSDAQPFNYELVLVCPD